MSSGVGRLIRVEAEVGLLWMRLGCALWEDVNVFGTTVEDVRSLEMGYLGVGQEGVFVRSIGLRSLVDWSIGKV